MSDTKPQRGEIWRVNLEPTRGSELKSDKGGKNDTRPVLVLNRPSVGTPGVSVCALITDYKPERDKPRFWRVIVGDAPESGLDKVSCADVSQTRALDISRFVRHAGRAHAAEVEATAAALARTVGHKPPQPKPQSEETTG